jgi:hypothetical protein
MFISLPQNQRDQTTNGNGVVLRRVNFVDSDAHDSPTQREASTRKFLFTPGHTRCDLQHEFVLSVRTKDIPVNRTGAISRGLRTVRPPR